VSERIFLQKNEKIIPPSHPSHPSKLGVFNKLEVQNKQVGDLQQVGSLRQVGDLQASALDRRKKSVFIGYSSLKSPFRFF